MPIGLGHLVRVSGERKFRGLALSQGSQLDALLPIQRQITDFACHAGHVERINQHRGVASDFWQRATG